METIKNIIGIMIGLLFLGFMGYLFGNSLIMSGASLYLIVTYLVLFLCSVLMYVWDMVLIMKGSKGSYLERNLRKYMVITFFLVVLTVFGYEVVLNHAPIFLIVFSIVCLFYIAPKLKKIYLRKISWFEARIYIFKLSIKLLLIFIIVLLICKAFGIPINEWKF